MQQKTINAINNQECNDAKFIAAWCTVVFGSNNIVNASITGANRSERTTEQLDPDKLKFIESIRDSF
jgi:hypothetical protein